MSNQKDLEELDLVIGKLTIFLELELFKEEFNLKKLKGERYKYSRVKRYTYDLLTPLQNSLEKVSKYSTYFEHFYPETSKIPNHEALIHHYHAYVEDLNHLKNISFRFLGCLKNDLKQFYENKEEIDDAISFMKNRTDEVFKDVNDLRNPYRHKGENIKDENMIDSLIAHSVLSTPQLDARLNSLGKQKIEKKKKESFKESKKYWSENASNNYSELSGFINNVIVKKNKKFLYGVLDVEPPQIINDE